MARFVCLEQLPARPLIFSFGSGVTFGLGRGTAGGCFVTPRQGTLQIRKTPWHGVTKQPPAVPLPGPNVTPEPNEKIKGLAGNCSRHTNQATRHPSNQENTLARRDETASCRPSARAKGSGRQLFQAHKTRCFPDLKGVLWLGLCAWNNCLPDP